MRSLLCAAALAVGVSQVPNRPATWQMNQSTIIMPCNYSGFTDPQTLAGFSVIDFGVFVTDDCSPNDARVETIGAVPASCIAHSVPSPCYIADWSNAKQIWAQ